MRAFGEILHEAVAFHGHLCPGHVLRVAKNYGLKVVQNGITFCRSLRRRSLLFGESLRRLPGEVTEQ